MPGAVPNTSTRALTNATLPYLLELARLGPERASAADPALAAGRNVEAGEITNPAVAQALAAPA
jgi:alanine dehydrogenase